jgi:hypothetical protein
MWLGRMGQLIIHFHRTAENSGDESNSRPPARCPPCLSFGSAVRPTHATHFLFAYKFEKASGRKSCQRPCRRPKSMPVPCQRPAYNASSRKTSHSSCWRTCQRSAHMPAHKKGLEIQPCHLARGHASTFARHTKKGWRSPP